MFSNKMLILTFLSVLVVAVESSGGGCKCTYKHDLNKSDLRKLLNSAVHKAERMKRPLEGMSRQLGPISHSGVRVTLADGSVWLVHKGDGYGKSSQTVVVDARHMSSKWEVVETKEFKGSKTVSDFIKAGGTDYSLLFRNCHHAAKEMMCQ